MNCNRRWQKWKRRWQVCEPRRWIGSVARAKPRSKGGSDVPEPGAAGADGGRCSPRPFGHFVKLSRDLIGRRFCSPGACRIPVGQEGQKQARFCPRLYRCKPTATSQLQCCRQNICVLRERKIKGIQSQSAKMSDIKQKAREIGDESISADFEHMFEQDGCRPKDSSAFTYLHLLYVKFTPSDAPKKTDTIHVRIYPWQVYFCECRVLFSLGQGIDARLARVRESTSLEQYLHLGNGYMDVYGSIYMRPVKTT